MLTFQQIIFKLQNYWADKGCTVIQPFDMEVGAQSVGTFLGGRRDGRDDFVVFRAETLCGE